MPTDCSQQERKRRRIEGGGEGQAMQDRPSGSSSDALPRDLVVEILSRVPASTLLRLQRVSKSWNSITHAPDFTNLHYHRAPADNRPLRLVIPNIRSQKLPGGGENLYRCLRYYSIFHDNGGNAWKGKLHSYYSGSLPASYCKQQMLGPCRGVLGFESEHAIDVFNPTIQEHVSVPKPNRAAGYQSDSVKLGFDPSTKKYKLVQLLSRYNEEGQPIDTRCEICTLVSGTTTWRSIPSLEIRNMTIDSWNGCEVKGALYWPVCRKDPFYIDAIASLDLKEDKFGLIPLPKSCSAQGNADNLENPWNMYLGRLDEEHLFFYVVYDFRVDIWMLEDATKHVWVKRYGIRTPDSCFLVPKYIWNGKILCYVEGNLLFYDPYKERFEQVDCNLKAFPPSTLHDCKILVESLCSWRN